MPFCWFCHEVAQICYQDNHKIVNYKNRIKQKRNGPDVSYSSVKVFRIVICKYKVSVTSEFYQKYSFRANLYSKTCLSDWSGTKK